VDTVSHLKSIIMSIFFIKYTCEIHNSSNSCFNKNIQWFCSLSGVLIICFYC